MKDTHARPPLIATLLAEHVHLARIMELMAAQLDELANGAASDSHVLYETVSYMVNWADRYHHPREDLIYGRAAELDRLQRPAPGCTLEHDAGRIGNFRQPGRIKARQRPIDRPDDPLHRELARLPNIDDQDPTGRMGSMNLFG